MPDTAQRCRYQSLWHAESEATNNSSGFQRAGSPLKICSKDPGMHASILRPIFRAGGIELLQERPNVLPHQIRCRQDAYGQNYYCDTSTPFALMTFRLKMLFLLKDWLLLDCGSLRRLNDLDNRFLPRLVNLNS